MNDPICHRDMAFMRLALTEAQAASEAGEVPVGAVIVQNDEVISKGHNLREVDGDPTAHAEIVAIRRAARARQTRRLTDCTLYVTLEPCPMCAGAIVMSGLKRVVYGAPDPQMGCAGSVYRLTEDPAFTHFAKADGGVLREECVEILQSFFRDK